MKRRELKVIVNDGNGHVDDGKNRPYKVEVLAPFGFQLPLPFDDEIVELDFFVVAANELEGFDLCGIISELSPIEIIDLRHVVRFDFPGSNRKHFFQCVKNVSAEYILEPVPWHKMSIKEIMGGGDQALNVILSNLLSGKRGRILFMVTTFSEIEKLEICINFLLSTEGNQSWKVERISSKNIVDE